MLPRDAAPPVVQRLAYRPPSHLIDEVELRRGLDQRAAQRASLGVEHPAEDDDPLTDRLAFVLAGQIVLQLAGYPLRSQLRPGDLGDRLGQLAARHGRRCG